MDLGRCAVRQALMQSLGIAKDGVMIQPSVEFRHVSILFQISVFILDRAPQPFNEDVLQSLSMLTRMPAASKMPVKAWAVNCTPCKECCRIRGSGRVVTKKLRMASRYVMMMVPPNLMLTPTPEAIHGYCTRLRSHRRTGLCSCMSRRHSQRLAFGSVGSG